MANKNLCLFNFIGRAFANKFQSRRQRLNYLFVSWIFYNSVKIMDGGCMSLNIKFYISMNLSKLLFILRNFKLNVLMVRYRKLKEDV